MRRQNYNCPLQMFFFLGNDRTVTSAGEWNTNLYFSVVTEDLLRVSTVETYPVDSFSDFSKDTRGRPRQVWVAHLLEFSNGFFRTWEEAWALAVGIWGYIGVGGKVLKPYGKGMDICAKGFGLYALYSRFSQTVPSGEMSFSNWLVSQKVFFEKKWLLQLKLELDVVHTSVNLLPLTRSSVVSSAAVQLLPLPAPPATSRRRKEMETEEENMLSEMNIKNESSLKASSRDFFLSPHLERLPMDRIEMRSLLIAIFGEDNELEAQEFYARIPLFGWKGSRKITVHWLDTCASHKLLSFRPARTGGGRIFILSGRDD